MRTILFTPRAKKDLSEIWDYTLEKWGEKQAETYLRDIFSKLELLADDLSISVGASDVRQGYKKIRVGSHVIFFKTDDKSINVVRVLNQRMDFDRHL